MSPLLLAFIIRSVYNVLPSRTNLQSPRHQMQTLRVFPVIPARALVMHVCPCPWALHMASQSGLARGSKNGMLPGKMPVKLHTNNILLKGGLVTTPQGKRTRNKEGTCFPKPKIVMSQQTSKENDTTTWYYNSEVSGQT